MDTQQKDIIDFIDAAIDSDELRQWLINLEKLPDNLRGQHLAEMKKQMMDNLEPDQILDIVEALNSSPILNAVNSVIRDVFDSGLKTDKYLNKQDNSNFNTLLTLIAAE